MTVLSLRANSPLIQPHGFSQETRSKSLGPVLFVSEPIPKDNVAALQWPFDNTYLGHYWIHLIDNSRNEIFGKEGLLVKGMNGKC